MESSDLNSGFLHPEPAELRRTDIKAGGASLLLTVQIHKEPKVRKLRADPLKVIQGLSWIPVVTLRGGRGGGGTTGGEGQE